MDLTLSQEHASLRATVEDFARKEVAPVIGEFYERGEFPYEIVAKMGAMGLFGLPIAEEYGGMGGDYFALCLALEELARVDSSVAITLEAGVSLGAMPIYRFGTEAQKHRWLPALAAGDHRPPGRRELGDQRVQGVHHQLRHRHHRLRHGHRADRRAADFLDHRPGGHARLPGRAEVLQGRLERF
jgi:Acyl-CoA dehydrogenase, N-terminal domain